MRLDVLDKLHCVLGSAGNTSAPVFAPTKLNPGWMSSRMTARRTELRTAGQTQSGRLCSCLLFYTHLFDPSEKKNNYLFSSMKSITEITFRVSISLNYKSQLTSSHVIFSSSSSSVPLRGGLSQSSAFIYLCVTPTITTTLCHLSLHPSIYLLSGHPHPIHMGWSPLNVCLEDFRGSHWLITRPTKPPCISHTAPLSVHVQTVSV